MCKKPRVSFPKFFKSLCLQIQVSCCIKSVSWFVNTIFVMQVLNQLLYKGHITQKQSDIITHEEFVKVHVHDSYYYIQNRL